MERRAVLKTGKCAACSRRTRKLHADHISPVVDPAVGFVDWNTYIERMGGKLQALCVPCHKAKTKKEGVARREARKNLKETK